MLFDGLHLFLSYYVLMCVLHRSTVVHVINVLYTVVHTTDVLYINAEVFNPGPQGPPVLYVLDVYLLQHT